MSLSDANPIDPNRLGAVLAGGIEALIERLDVVTPEMHVLESARDPNAFQLSIEPATTTVELTSLLSQLGPTLNDFEVKVRRLNGGANRDYYESALMQLGYISILVNEITRTSQRMSTGLDTLKRYERSTRATLKELLQYIQHNEGENRFIGAREIHMNTGEGILISPRGAYIFPDGITREPWIREPYMEDQKPSRIARYRQSLMSVFTRLLSGESAILDQYTADKDEVLLPISPNEIGGDIVTVNLAEGPIIARSKVYFGNQKDVVRRIETPLAQISKGNFWPMVKKAAYGPGVVLQRFEAREGGKNLDLLMQLDGDWRKVELRDGEQLPMDPRNVYMWQSNVSYDVVKFARAWEVMVRDTIPFKVVFRGPKNGVGSVWVSNKDYTNGYWGQFFTPSHWIHYTIDVAKNLATLPFKTGK